MILLEQISYPKDGLHLFEGAEISKVEVSKSKKTLHFYLSLKQVIPAPNFLVFIEKFQNTFQKISTINEATFEIVYQNAPSQDDVVKYFPMVIAYLSRENLMIRFLESFTVNVSDEKLDILVSSERDVTDIDENYAHLIQNAFKTFGLFVGDVTPIISEESKSEEEFEREREAALPEIKPPAPRDESDDANALTKEKNDAKPANKYRSQYKRPDPVATETSFGPRISGEVATCRDVTEGNAVLEGYIFAAEARDVKNGELMIITAKLTDYTDSIYIKMFLREGEARNRIPKILAKGNWIKVSGKVAFDDYAREIAMTASAAELIESKAIEERIDTAPDDAKRVELHLHTKMSAMDGVTDIGDYIAMAAKWGHKAIAFTDHGVMQAVPEAYKAAKKHDMKVLYGLEGNLVEDAPRLGWNNLNIELTQATYVVYDVETTGLSTNYDDIIEIAAVKVKDGIKVDEFGEFINPSKKLTQFTMDLTHITQEDVDNARDHDIVMGEFFDWVGDAILVAHNADFDMGHLNASSRKLERGEVMNPVMDTLAMARVMYHFEHGVYWNYATDEKMDERFKKKMKRFNLKALAKFFSVDLTQHHRAIYDSRATADAFIGMLQDLAKLRITRHSELNGLTEGTQAFKLDIPSHITLLAKNAEGLKNLFKIVSISLTTDLYGQARMRRSVVEKYREGILIGSSCVNGEVFDTAINKPYEQLQEKVKFYDYLEVQPPEVYSHLHYSSGKEMPENIKKTIQKIIQVGKEQDVMVCATGDVHHLDPEDTMYRQIYTRTPMIGGGRHPLNRKEIKEIPSMHLRTTDEMLTDFDFLDDETRHEIVITNPNKIADMCEEIKPIKDELFTPSDDFLAHEGIPSIQEKLREMCYIRAHELYGDTLPGYVNDRLEKELKSIIGNGFAVIYYISHLLVKRSLDDGYLVGSRGSVGSSFVATLVDITEVNPLSPHYLCLSCKFSMFKMTDEEKERYGTPELGMNLMDDLMACESGFDLPDATCPSCSEKLGKEGHDIPFETFLGFKGDKVPDIDLNFSGDYQAKAHLYCRDLFGSDFAFRAGTITTVAEKTAYGFVKGYLEDSGKEMRSAEIERVAMSCEGVRRSTGQHPGGIIVVPNYMDIYDITPVQYPADDANATWMTTHFDFHSIHDNLLKLDILGHDDPSMLRYLEDISGVSPKEIPLDDEGVYELFNSTKSLGVTPEQIKSTTGSYGVPEFGTFFVRAMLNDTKPKTFAELVKISGLSHGTDVWTNNAADLVSGKKGQYGKVEFKNVIGCRDDIMVYLMYGGLEPALAFEIMEFVRKGLASKVPDKWDGYAKAMREKGIPEWYIWSCGQIKYMFPKAHATAYVLMAVRIAWFKVHMPIHYYAAYFSKRADSFDIETMVKGADAIAKKIDEINAKGFDASPKEKNLITILELALEMTSRGLNFENYNLEQSQATEFKISEDGKSLIPPFSALDGLGDNVAFRIVEEREEGDFNDIMDFKRRTKASKTIIEELQLIGFFGDMPYGYASTKVTKVPEGQISLF